MAIFTPGPIVSDIRGSIGGTTFGRNRAGLFARQKVVPVNPNSPAQVTRRAQFSLAAIRWRNLLTQAERDSWNTLATTTIFKNSVGGDFNPSGFQLYIRTNLMQQILGQTEVTTAPTTATFALGDLTIVHTTGVGIEVTAAVGFGSPGDFNVQLSANQSQGISFFKGPFLSFSIRSLAALSTLPLLLVGNISLVPARKFFLRLRAGANDGRVTESQIFAVVTSSPL